MHIRCGLVPLIRKNICSRNSELPSRASEALELDGAALHMLSTGRVGGGRQGGGGAEAACPGVGRVSHLLHNAADPPERRRRLARR